MYNHICKDKTSTPTHLHLLHDRSVLDLHNLCKPSDAAADAG